MNKRKSFGLNIGAPSIVVILVVLCLVCFAGLSMVSANADLNLSRKYAERTSAYYHACNEAQQALLEASKKEPVEDSFSGTYIINEHQVLSVSAVCDPLSPNSNPYTITEWRIVTTTNPELDTSLPVLFRD